MVGWSGRMEVVDQANIRTRIEAVNKLLAGETTNLEKIEEVRNLLLGFNPKIDSLTKSMVEMMAKVDNIVQGDVALMGVESLSEDTAEEKKRKRMLLLFLKSWRDLQSEIKRVELNMGKPGGSLRTWRWAKGPLGLITVIAVGVVLLKTTAVTVNIKNVGCDALRASFGIGEIKNGETVQVKLPPVTLGVDTSQKGTVILSGYKLNMTFDLGGAQLMWNGESLAGKKSVLRLGERKIHHLEIKCI